jgi:hypothetical protein
MEVMDDIEELEGLEEMEGRCPKLFYAFYFIVVIRKIFSEYS